MLLAEESTKYVGDDQGILNLKLMQQLHHIIAYNLAKSRTARDGNKVLERKNFRPKHLKLNGLVLVRDHTSKAFEAKATDHHIVDFLGHNRVIVKDNHGNIKKVHVKDVKPIEIDIATVEFFRKEREQCTTRDAKHVMPVKQIPDLNWKFDENINQVETAVATETAGATEAAAETPKAIEDTAVAEASEMVKDTEATEASEAVEDTEAAEASEAAETSETVETTEAVETITVTTCTTKASQKIEEQQGKCSPCTPTPPGSLSSDISNTTEIQNTPTEETTQITPKTKQAIQKIHQTPEVSNSLVTKIFSAFRPVKDTSSQPIPEYGLQI